MKWHRPVRLAVHELFDVGNPRSAHLVGRAFGDYAAFGHEVDVVNHVERFLNVVSDYDGGSTQ